jgi:CdiI immunity protein
MTGQRARRLLGDEARRRYWRLSQFLGSYLHEDWPIHYGTPEAAVDAAIAEYPVELRQVVRQQLNAVLVENEDDVALERLLDSGFGVNVRFKHASEARAFAEDVERRLLVSIKEHFDGQRSGSRDAL